MTRYSLPRTMLSARLRLTEGDLRGGTIFVADRVPHHDGPETVLEMLNRPESFYPFRSEAEDEILLVAKAHTVSLSVAEPAIVDPDRLSAARMAEVEVILAGGTTLAGRASFELPDFHQRLLDYLNASRDPFFAVAEGDSTHYVNRAHVLFARPKD
ncbi:MAG: hypothetical protein HY560_07270 [Gemmatimonadetes bacterium]|nr:hypothetical protein [Gemmatimonadota bacterium]